MLDLDSLEAKARAVDQGVLLFDGAKLYADTTLSLIRELREARAAVAAEREACADAESDAGRLALELECLLLSISDMPTVSRWWDSANEALDLHRSRLDAIRARAAKGGE